MLKRIERFMRDESGLETVEWAIVGGVVVAVGAAFFAVIGGHTSTGINNLHNATAKIK